VLQQALDREDMPAEAGMRQDLSHKLRQVEGQLQAQREQAGPRQEAGPKEAGPRPTTPTCTTCTTPTCGAAESVAVAAEAEASATAGPSEQGCEQTSSSSEQAPVARLLLELSDDLLLVCTARACAPHVPVHRTCLCTARACAPHVHGMCMCMACACAMCMLHVHVHVPCACCMCMCMCHVHVACACALQEILCQLGVADLLGAASSCRVLHRACAARGCDGAWHRLCTVAWPRLSVALHTASTELAKRGATTATTATTGTAATIGTAATATTPATATTAATATTPATPAATATIARCTAPLPLPLDWHVLLRERRRLSHRWEPLQPHP
jgi:hypothetical protein